MTAFPRKPIQRKTRKQLTRKNELFSDRLDRIEKDIFEMTFDFPFKMLPPPGKKEGTTAVRLRLLEEKIELIIEHLGIEIKEQPKLFVITEKKKKS
ncbi:MAG: hypothetical protein ACOCVA_00970 [Prolixibacteraceae bacterium]